MSDGFKVRRPHDDPEFEYMVNRSRECLLWRMSPDYWDAMTMDEHAAWLYAWHELQQEREGH